MFLLSGLLHLDRVLACSYGEAPNHMLLDHFAPVGYQAEQLGDQGTITRQHVIALLTMLTRGERLHRLSEERRWESGRLVAVTRSQLDATLWNAVHLASSLNATQRQRYHRCLDDFREQGNLMHLSWAGLYEGLQAKDRSGKKSPHPAPAMGCAPCPTHWMPSQDPRVSSWRAQFVQGYEELLSPLGTMSLHYKALLVAVLDGDPMSPSKPDVLARSERLERAQQRAWALGLCQCAARMETQWQAFEACFRDELLGLARGMPPALKPQEDVIETEVALTRAEQALLEGTGAPSRAGKAQRALHPEDRKTLR